jgi:hypothetical protein
LISKEERCRIRALMFSQIIEITPLISSPAPSEIEDLPKYFLRFDKGRSISISGNFKARISPSNWEYHLQSVHQEVLKK